MNQDYLESYKTLGLTHANSWDDIKLAYRRQVQIWHPDRHQDGSEEEYRESSEKFLAITTAYENLERYYKDNGKLPPIPEKPRPQVTPEESRTRKGEDTDFSIFRFPFKTAVCITSQEAWQILVSLFKTA